MVGEGTPIVFVPGLAGTHLDWYKMSDYVGVLRGRYRLILMDPRGRGKSDKPHEPENHSLRLMVGDVTAILDDLGLEKAHFWGYSMGGTVGLAAGVYAPERFHSLIVGGAGLAEKSSSEQVEKYNRYVREYEARIPLHDQGVEVATAHLKESRGEDVDNYTVERWMNADPRALVAYCSNHENIGMAEILPKLTLPCLLYAGEADSERHANANKCHKVMQNSTFVSLPGLNHVGGFTRTDVVIPVVQDFLKKVLQ